MHTPSFFSSSFFSFYFDQIFNCWKPVWLSLDSHFHVRFIVGYFCVSVMAPFECVCIPQQKVLFPFVSLVLSHFLFKPALFTWDLLESRLLLSTFHTQQSPRIWKFWKCSSHFCISLGPLACFNSPVLYLDWCVSDGWMDVTIQEPDPHMSEQDSVSIQPQKIQSSFIHSFRSRNSISMEHNYLLHDVSR